MCGNIFQKKNPFRIVASQPKVVGEIFKKDGWCFNWRGEYKKPDRHMFYLRTCTDDRRVQGLISATPIIDAKFIFLHLIEKAPIIWGRKSNMILCPNVFLHLCARLVLKWVLRAM